jgi:hypothetical protein
MSNDKEKKLAVAQWKEVAFKSHVLEFLGLKRESS